MEHDSPEGSPVQMTGDDPCYSAFSPELVDLGRLGQDAVTLLAARVAHSGCQLLLPADEGAGPCVLRGSPSDLGWLRNLLLTERSLELVRESIEAYLARLAPGNGQALPDLAQARKLDPSEGEQIPKGTTLQVSRDFLFDAAHNLPRYNGKCERLHGHTFRIRVTVDAPLDSWSGMAFDFHDLKQVVKTRVVDVLDHSYVNECIPNPSAENIAIWAWQRLVDLPLAAITVWETPTCCVTYSGPPA